MGIETDYIMSDGSNLQEIFDSNNPHEEFDGVYGKGSDPMSLSALYFSQLGEELDLDFIDQFDMIIGDADGRGLYTIPLIIQDCIKKINKKNVDEYLANWCETAEFLLTGWDEDMAKEFLLDLSKLITSDNKKSLYMWMCV